MELVAEWKRGSSETRRSRDKTARVMGGLAMWTLKSPRMMAAGLGVERKSQLLKSPVATEEWPEVQVITGTKMGTWWHSRTVWASKEAMRTGKWHSIMWRPPTLRPRLQSGGVLRDEVAPFKGAAKEMVS